MHFRNADVLTSEAKLFTRSTRHMAFADTLCRWA